MKKWKRAFIVGLVTMMLSMCVIGSYQKANSVKAVAGVDDILVICGILALFGITVSIPTWTGDTWLGDEPIDDQTAKELTDWWHGLGGDTDSDVDKWMKENGYMDENGELTDAWYDHLGQEKPTTGGGSGGDDGDDGSDLWKSIKNFFKDSKDNGLSTEVAVGTALGTVLALAASKLMMATEKGEFVSSGVEIDNKFLEEVQARSAKTPYVFIGTVKSDSSFYDKTLDITMFEHQPYFYVKSRDSNGEPTNYAFGSMIKSGLVQYYTVGNSGWREVEQSGSSFAGGNFYPSNYYNFSANFPCYEDLQSCKNALKSGDKNIKHPSNINPDTVGQNSDSQLQPQPFPQPLYENTRIPTMTDLKDYYDGLDNAKDDDEKQKVIDEWINKLTKPGGGTDPGTDPDNPDKPDPDNPDKPDPDNPDKPDPDNPTNDGSGGLPNLLFPLEEIFPFCIPFDLIMAFKLFEAPAEAPVWRLPLKVELLGIDYELVIDFNDFEHLAVVLRWIELVGFIIGLIMITRSHLIHG